MKLAKFYGFALTALAASALVACSNELREPSANLSDGLKLAKAPDVTAWSGNHTFSNTKTVADLNTIAPSIAQNIVSPSTQTRTEEESPVTVTECNVTIETWDYEAAA